MKWSLLLSILLCFLAVPAGAAPVKFAEAGVSFESPPGFTALSTRELDLKYPSKRAPAHVVGNKLRSVTIAYDLKPHALQPEDLPEIKATFEAMFERIIPRIEWVDRRILDKQGQQWILFEMTSRALDTDIHNIMLVTPRKGKMLVFNFNSTKEEFPKVEAALRKSLDSIDFEP